MWDWVLLVVGLLTALYWYMSWHNGYWRSHGVYSLPGALPGVGHMWEVLTLKKNVGWKHTEIYHLTKGQPAVGIYNFRKPELVLRDLELVKTVLISDFSSFHDNAADVDESIEPHISRSAFLLKGQRWKALRQQLAPAFSPGKVKAMLPLIENICREFNNYMEKRQNEDIDVRYVTGLFTSEVVARCAFGVDGDAFKDTNAEFYNQSCKLWEHSLNNPFFVLFLIMLPFINKKIIKKSILAPSVTAFFVSLITQSEEYRKRNPDKSPENDYLQFLFNLKAKDPNFTFDDVIAQSITFFTDGFETSALTASFVIYELTVNPGIQEAVRKEVQAMDAFTYENITSLPLLDRVLQETMRKRSILSLTKECTKDCVLEAQGVSFPVRKGQQVVVPVYAIHHDPEIYPDPEVFNPDRFLNEHVKDRHPVSFLGFGAGPRICIGNRFASCQIKVLVANILANFRLLKCDKTVEKMKLSPQQFMPVPEQGIWARFQKL